MLPSRQAEDYELKFAGRNDVLPTVEVDTGDDFEVFLACEAAIEKILAASTTPKRITIYVYESPSINFRRQTNSIFFAVAGPASLLARIHAALTSISGAGVRYGDYISASSCSPSFHLEAGTLWRPVESDTWQAVEAPPDAGEKG